MDTNILFKIDKKTKERASKKARKQGLTLSAFLRSATKAFVDGDLDISVEVGAKTKKAIERGVGEIKSGKSSSHEEIFSRLGV